MLYSEIIAVCSEIHTKHINTCKFCVQSVGFLKRFSQNCEKRLSASSCLSVRPHGKTRLPPDILSWNLIFECFSKSVKKIQISLKSHKNNGYLAWKPMCMRNVSDKICRENQNTHFMFNNFFRKSCRLWDNVEKYGTVRQATDNNIIRCLRFACWITKATDTHSQYVIFIAFPRQQWLRERASVLR
jgi:hypothetical protein